MTSPTRIELPPQGRPVGGLLSSARPIGGEWWRGVTFSSGQCLSPQNVGNCSTDPEDPKEFHRPSTPSEFQAFNVLQAVECSTMGRTDTQKYADVALDVTRDFGVGRELLTGAATGNPSLISVASHIGVANDAVEAVACIEQNLADNMHGRLGFVHVPALILTYLLSSFAIWRDGRVWRTASGHLVVTSAGYDGRGPDPSVGPPDPGDTLFIYATGEVFAEVGQRDTFNAVDRSVNTDQALAEDAAVVAFDPCYAVAIDTGVGCSLSAS